MRIAGIGVIIVVIGAVIAGFIAIGSPADSRARRFDQQRLGHLSTIQWQVVSYWQTKGSLPKTLDDLNDDLSGFRVPVDPDTGKSYAYETRGSNAFSLCAVFFREGGSGEKGKYPPFRAPMMMSAKPVPYPDGGPFVSESWQHGAGRTCFERTIDPQRYKPYREKQE